MSLIGVIRWLVEFGRININLKYFQLSSFLTTPRTWHFNQALDTFRYLQNYDISWLPMNSTKLILQYKGPEKFSPECRREKCETYIERRLIKYPIISLNNERNLFD